VASRNAKEVCDEGKGVGETGLAVYLDFAEAIKRDGLDVIMKKYGNLFQMYQKITDSDPSKEPMMIYPAVHYTMGGLWVDYQLQSTINGLFVLGEANFSDHGANRLGASALMQGLADGYFILPYTIGNYLAQAGFDKQDVNHAAFNQAEQDVSIRIAGLLKNRDHNKPGARPVDYYHRKLGAVLWDYCGMARNREGLTKALSLIPEIREEFHANAYVPGSGQELNQSLERAGRVADFLEFAEIMVLDALEREESCGCHLREESQTEEHEAKRDDDHYSHVAVWEHRGDDQAPVMHKEPLRFENVTPSQRSYK
jgi:succinate dehydrogenase / fumarate reductase flavoprotein subunit